MRPVAQAPSVVKRLALRAEHQTPEMRKTSPGIGVPDEAEVVRIQRTAKTPYHRQNSRRWMRTYGRFAPMSSHGLPQTGWWTIEEFADALQEKEPTFQKKLQRYGIPHKRWGNTILIRAEDFYRGLEYHNGSPEEEDEG